MTISQRLNEVLQKVRPEVPVPIIVEVIGDPAQASGVLRSVGMSIKYVSKTLPLIYGSGNSAVIQLVNQQPFVREISYDEPTFAL